MPLSSGARLGPYEVQAAIGAGGMGEVYRARDTRLERTVAIKVLPAVFSQRPELRKRLEREARALSSLSHPHICTLYDVGEQDGMDFLVMEYLEGDTLADRLIKGPLPTELLLRYGSEIADALERAHRHGVIHRDLKPGNIMLTKDGTKLLDFGLARIDLQSTPAAETLTQVDSDDRKLTEEGVLLGTFQYMAPEQLEGKDADTRTDIFALGAVLYEMATGGTAFTGRNRASLIASILVSEPPSMSSLQPLTPPALERVVKTCLAKEPDARWQSAHDLKLQLEWIAERGSQAGVPAPVVARRRSRERLAWVTCVVLALALAFALARWPTSATRVASRFLINPPEQHSFFYFEYVSPDGRTLALTTTDQEGKISLWLRPLDSVLAHELPETEGAVRVVWSSDSRFLLFVVEDKLKKIDSLGGIPDTLCDAKGMSVESWNSNHIVLLANSSEPAPIQQLNLEDCGLKPATKLDVARYDGGHQWPSFLPDGKHFVYSGLRTDKKHDVLLGTLGSEASEILVHNASNPKYAPPGYLFFERNGYLFTQSFSLSNLRLTGESVQVVPQQLMSALLRGIASYDVSDGVLTYQERAESKSRLAVLDYTGKQLETLGESPDWGALRLAPDRKKFLIGKGNIQTHTGDLWIYDLQRKDWERFSVEASPDEGYGVWSPDGQTIVYSAAVKGKYNLYRRPVDRSRDAEPLLESALDKVPTDWSPDGRWLLYYQSDTSGAGDLWVWPMERDAKPSPLPQTHSAMGDGRFSPDGHWIVYNSDESGKPEIYVRPFPGPGSKWRVSSGAGIRPQWSRDGRKIYYLTLEWKLMEIPVNLGTSVVAGTPRVLFSLPEDSEYELLAPGKFLVMEQAGQLSGRPTVVLNWDAALGPKK